MNYKVLLADDSLTIQKVIKITLANQPFDIVDCTSDDELFKKLPQVQPELVFLDFNLSEKYSGYELASKIKSIVPTARILLLLGTFDTIDEIAMQKSGASDKIVKPFDSNKFIALCKRLVDTATIVELSIPETKKEEFIVPQEEDQWKMSHTIEEKILPEQPKPVFDIRNHLNPLDQEVTEWGMSIPAVIHDESSHEKKIDLPSIISAVKPEVKDTATLPANSSSEIKFPENDDLDYPTIEEMAVDKNPMAEEKLDALSKLISIESFKQEPEIEFEIEHTIDATEEAADVSSIEAQIRDEVEIDLWKVDEFEDLKKEVAAKIEAVNTNFNSVDQKFDESLFKPLDENEEIQRNATSGPISFETYDEPQRPVVSQPDMQVLRSEMEEMIKKHVKEYLDEMFKQKVEKISWEIIPDLAENLIRQEMSKISNKILKDSN